jgi:Fe-coproporphyrin III synthase
MVALRDAFRRWRNLATHTISTLPVLVLMPREGCNSRCLTCDLWRPGSPGRELPTATLERDLDLLRRWRVRRVVISGGEPLLHSDLWGLCGRLKSLPAKITLLTNGLLLARHARDVARWCDEVIVSLDGTGPTHDALRGVPGATERLAGGIAAVRAVAPSLRVTGRCVLQRRNYAELPEIIEEAGFLDLDRISFLAADVSTRAFNRSVPWDGDRVSGVALSPADVERFGAVLERAARERTRDFDSGYVAESPARLRALLRYYAALNGDGAFPPVSCNAPWMSAVIEADGTVRPCFFHRPLGNLNERPLDSILNSPDAVTFRRSLDVKGDPICRRCVCTLSLGLRAPA